MNKLSNHKTVCFHVFTGWIEDIKAYNKLDSFSFPIIADPTRDVAKTFGMIDPDEKDAKGIPLTCRYVSVLF